jgi:eukaryotic-like serine/threonine-protein kinase
VATRFGAYEILYELKSGGMGAVLLGRRRGPGTFEQLVAIKTIRPEYAAAPAVRAMFLDEAAILARLNHPGIATVHDFGEEGGTLYMVMEYVAGIAFRDLRDVPPAIVARAIAEGARGLNAAHEARDMAGHLMGLVHRDISPDNLMLGYDGHVKVIDFGIALVKNRQAPVTEFGTVKGKPPYMSPEQVKNEPMDHRSDVFSLAVVTWELLTGKPLFEGESIYSIALAVEQQAIIPPSKVVGEKLPAGLDAAVMAALERDPEQRTPTAAAYAEQLEGVVQAGGGESLAAWAARELETKRTEHRTWLTSVVTGANLPRARGRESGQATEVGAVAPVADAAIVKAPGAGLDPVAETSIGSDDPDTATPPRGRLAPVVLVLLALLVTAIAIWFAVGAHPNATRRIDAGLAIVTPVIDAGAITVEPADAIVITDAEVTVIAPPPDAGHHVVVRHRDAGVVAVTPPADAAPVGTGLVDIKVKSADDYAVISIDGGNGEAPPVNNRSLSAGRHVIRFLDPRTGTVLDTQAIELANGQKLVIRQH